MTSIIWVANLFGWPVIHIVIAFVALRLPADLFERDTWVTAPRRWEQSGRVYRERLAIRKWKSLLPDGAPWLGGFAKKRLKAHDPQFVARFLLETRRAELAHWCMLCCLPIFFIWNPPWASFIMTAYAALANLPCILAQRYNRFALDRAVRIRRHSLSCQ